MLLLRNAFPSSNSVRSGFRRQFPYLKVGNGGRGDFMNTFPILLGALCVYALAYRYYSAFLAAKAMVLDDRRITPAHAYKDGHNYVPSPKWVLFGHHFAAIAGAGPLVGPTLAAQFGFRSRVPVAADGRGACGMRAGFHRTGGFDPPRGRSLADIARTEISPFAGLVAMIAVLVYSAGDAGRAGHRGRQCAGEQSMGRIHDRHDRSDRAHHGRLDVQEPRRSRSRSPGRACLASCA